MPDSTRVTRRPFPRPDYPRTDWIFSSLPATFNVVWQVGINSQALSFRTPPPAPDIKVQSYEWDVDGWVFENAVNPRIKRQWPGIESETRQFRTGERPKLRVNTQEWEANDGWPFEGPVNPLLKRQWPAVEFETRQFRMPPDKQLQVQGYEWDLDGWQFPGAVEPLLRRQWPAIEAETRQFRTPPAPPKLVLQQYEWRASPDWIFSGSVEPLLKQWWPAVEHQLRQARTPARLPLQLPYHEWEPPTSSWIFGGAVEPLLRQWWPAVEGQLKQFLASGPGRLQVQHYDWDLDGWQFKGSVEPLLLVQWPAIEAATRQFRVGGPPALRLPYHEWQSSAAAWIFPNLPSLFDPATWPAIDQLAKALGPFARIARFTRPDIERLDWLGQQVDVLVAQWRPAQDQLLQTKQTDRRSYRFVEPPDVSWIFQNLPSVFDPATYFGTQILSDRPGIGKRFRFVDGFDASTIFATLPAVFDPTTFPWAALSERMRDRGKLALLTQFWGLPEGSWIFQNLPAAVTRFIMILND